MKFAFRCPKCGGALHLEDLVQKPRLYGAGVERCGHVCTERWQHTVAVPRTREELSSLEDMKYAWDQLRKQEVTSP